MFSRQGVFKYHLSPPAAVSRAPHLSLEGTSVNIRVLFAIFQEGAEKVKINLKPKVLKRFVQPLHRTQFYISIYVEMLRYIAAACRFSPLGLLLHRMEHILKLS